MNQNVFRSTWRITFKLFSTFKMELLLNTVFLKLHSFISPGFKHSFALSPLDKSLTRLKHGCVEGKQTSLLIKPHSGIEEFGTC